MVDKTELRMNLAAIKRVDPYAKDIVTSSAHVAFYTFNPDENEWEKTDVEGVFFIYSRNAEPFNSIFINNRLNTNSFVEPITGHLELQSQPPFLLYRNERSRIRGFWFYNSSECDRIGELVERLIKETSDSKTKTTISSTNSITQFMMKSEAGSNSNSINIFHMLSKAQEDFTNSQHQTPNTNVSNIKMIDSRMAQQPQQQQQHQLQQQQPQVQQQQPQTQQQQQQPLHQISASNNQLDIASQSVMNFFAAAKPAAASEVPLFQRLLSNPVSVDQIEKQQRAATPQDGKISPPIAPINIVENGMNLINLQSPKQFQQQSNQNHTLSTSPLAKFLSSTSANPKNNGRNCTSVQSSSSTKPALMPPTMFLSSSSASVNLEISNKQTQKIIYHNDIINLEDTTSKPEPLTQTQLLQAMTYLIKNDPDFVKKLHEAYLKSFTEMVSL